MLGKLLVLGGFKIHTSSLFLLMAVLCASYIIWKEGKKDGFDEENLFDAIIASLLSGVFTGRVVFAFLSFTSPINIIKHILLFWTPGIDILGAIFGIVFIIFVWSRYQSYSIYRILDVFTLGVIFAIPVFLFSTVFIEGNYTNLIVICILFTIFYLFSTLRAQKVLSGTVCGLAFVLSSVVSGALLYNKISLIFSLILFTLGGVILFKRFRDRNMQFSSGISKDFLKKVQNLLKKKEKELGDEEKLLKKEDSYKVPERDTLNNEFEDEAYEDEQHVNTDILTKSIVDMRNQVRRALARINIGTYGICEICHKPIDKARLKAFPQATTCVECEERKSEKAS